MEKLRLGAALATLRADMEALSAAHVSSPPGVSTAQDSADDVQFDSERACCCHDLHFI